MDVDTIWHEFAEPELVLSVRNDVIAELDGR
jgi:hypothetical protein